MSRKEDIQNNFSSGEITPDLLGRIDTVFYQYGSPQLKNFNIMTTGGLERRSGFKYIDEPAASDNRLIPYILDETDRYILAFSSNLIEIYKGDSVLALSGTPITVATDYTDMSLIQYAQVGNLCAITYPGKLPMGLERDFADEFIWSLSALPLYDGPYSEVNKNSDQTVTLTGTLGIGNVITATSTHDIFKATDCVAGGGIIDRHFRIRSLDKDHILIGKITAFTSTKIVSITVDLNTTAAAIGDWDLADYWRLGAISTTSGFPTLVAFHEQRLMFANTESEPQAIWGSKLNDFYKFSPTGIGENVAAEVGQVTDAESFKAVIAANDSANITFIITTNRLAVGTSNGVYALTSGTAASLSPLNLAITKQNSLGAASIRPIAISGAIIYSSDNKRKLVAAQYDYETDALRGRDITVTANHIFHDGVCKQLAVGSSGDFIYILTVDGRLYRYTFNTEQGIFAYNQVILGGTYRDTTNISNGLIRVGSTYYIANNTAADFTGVGALDNDIGTRFVATDISPIWGASGILHLITAPFVDSVMTVGDVVYISCSRESQSSIEILTDQPVITHDQDKLDFYFLDNHISYDLSTATDAFTAVHLADQTISIFADGARYPDVAVSLSGTFTIAATAKQVVAGSSYISLLETPPTNVTLENRAHRVGLLLRNAFGVFMNQDEIELRSYNDNMDVGPPLFNGYIETAYKIQHEYMDSINITCEDPFPCKILYVIQKLSEGGR